MLEGCVLIVDVFYSTGRIIQVQCDFLRKGPNLLINMLGQKSEYMGAVTESTEGSQ
jgi:hypothetical protein